MKTAFLIPGLLIIIFNVESCPVTRPTDASSSNETREMDAAPGDSIVQTSESLKAQHSLSIEKLRRTVREIIRPRCGACHTSTLATAKPRAIRIFDLVRDDWSSVITRDHFKGFTMRLQHLNTADKTMVDELVRTELARRSE